MTSQLPFRQLFVLILNLLLLAACSSAEQTLPAAPVGDIKSLRSLADAYQQQSDQLEASPLKLRPEARKKFVIRVFNKAGFSYRKTLIALGDTDVSSTSKNHRDLAQLLRIPHYGLPETEKKALYDEQELAAIAKMEKW